MARLFRHSVAGNPLIAALIDQQRLAAAEDCFPPALVLHVLGAYYQHPRVLSALGLDPRPPHPDGYRMAPDDLALLEPVRRRPRMYRSI